VITDETVIYLDLGQVVEIHAATMKSMWAARLSTVPAR
jgi:hypothetical protein